MGCLIGLVALASPRLALFLLWVFSDRISLAIDSAFVSFLGFLLLPWTTLAWVAAYAPVRGVDGIGWLVVGIAFLADLGSLGVGERGRRRR